MAEGVGGIPEPPASPEIEGEGGQEVPEIPGPRNFVILQEDDTFDFAYTIGTLDLDSTEGDKSCEIAAIAVIDNKLLVAVPEAVWSRSVQKRRLGSRALSKPNLVAVASCLEDAREAEDDIVVQLRVWVGFLHPELEKNLEFLGPAEADFTFGEHEGQRAVPFGPALVEVANEHFNFMTAESAVPEASQQGDSGARLDHLEAMMRDMKSGLDALLSQATGGAALLPPSQKKREAGGAGGGQRVAGQDRASMRGLDSLHRGKCTSSRHSCSSPLRGWKDHEGATQATRRSSAATPRSSWRPPLRVRGRHGASGRGRSGRSWRRWWICRGQQCGEGTAGAHKDCWEAGCQQDQEGAARGFAGWRRVWISHWKRRELWGWKTECSSTSSLDKVLPVRLPIQTCATWRTTRPRDYGARLVSLEEQSAKLPESCSMGLAGCWSMGLPHIGEGRGGKGEMCPSCWSGRPGQHRPGKLVDFECLSAGAASPVSALRKPCCSKHSGDTAYGALRPAVGRLVSQSSQGGGFLCGDQEETGRQITHYKDGEARWRRARTSQTQSEGEGKVERRKRRVRGGGRVSFDEKWKGDAKAGPPLSGDDSQPAIQLPGSRAPTFHGRSLLKCCWRFLLKGKCRLSSFARSFVSRRFDHSTCRGTAASGVFPMPLPYPEVLRRGSLEDSLQGSVKRWVCGVVVCLNYLFLGRPRTAGEEVWIGRPLTQKQWLVVREA